MRPLTSRFPALRHGAAASAILTLVIPAQIPADGTQRAGRYLDRSVIVNEASQLNPLQQVATLEFSSRITVAEALKSALAGTGYHLLDPDVHPDSESRALLRTRLAIPHQQFDTKRIDSVIAAVVGAGRGFGLEVDHVARRIRIVPLRAPAPVPKQVSRRPLRAAPSPGPAGVRTYGGDR